MNYDTVVIRVKKVYHLGLRSKMVGKQNVTLPLSPQFCREAVLNDISDQGLIL